MAFYYFLLLSISIDLLYTGFYYTTIALIN